MSGSINKVAVQDGGVETNRVGDYMFFDDRNTGGAGAQGLISHIEGKEVFEGYGSRLTTKIISHRQLLDLTDNVDDDGRAKTFTFVQDQGCEVIFY